MKVKQWLRSIWHGLLCALVAAGKERHSGGEPKRILILNGAHIGDVVIATSLLPVLKSAFPKAQIGFLTASWAHAVTRNHPDIAYTHCADHWRMNRAAAGFFRKRWHYWTTRRQALKEIRALAYDVSLSLHPWRADFLPLTWQAKIPARAAFSRSLFAPLATTLADYPDEKRLVHQGECQAMLLRALGIADEHLLKRRSSLAPSSGAAVNEVRDLLRVAEIDEARDSIIHMGAGVKAKEPPLTFWREMAAALSADRLLVFTGKGARECLNIEQVMAGLSNCVDAGDKLSWDAFVAAVRHAQTLYAVDSMAAHVAAAVGTKCVAVFGGMSTIARWRPEAKSAVVWSKPVPCAPCQQQYGCATRKCMEGFVTRDILQIQ